MPGLSLSLSVCILTPAVCQILRRACVWWNPDLSDYGEWDTDGCAAVEYSDFHTKCACAHFGQIAIMVQKVRHCTVRGEKRSSQDSQLELALAASVLKKKKRRQLTSMSHA